MAPPVVVQGTAVSDPYADQAHQMASYGNNGTITKGEVQEKKCRDPIFALLLYANVGAIVGVTVAYGADAFNEQTDSGYDYTGYMYSVLITGLFSLFLSGMMLLVMMRIPSFLIKTSLLFVVALTGVWAILAFLNGAIGMGVLGLVFFALGVCYAKAVWSRIPFATANLITATSAIKSNCGVSFIAYILVALAFGWSVLWAVAFMGVWNKTYDCNADNTQCNINYGYLFLLFVSYFFTHQVIQNTVHVTVAGVVGTWWFAPEDSGFCGAGVFGSFFRAMTTSFGSICFGSLIVAVIQALRQLANTARANDDGGIMACIAECILACLQGMVEYFNQWAFIYVGLYGYGYLEAGKNVFTLFKNRGWEAVIADDLVGNTLFFVSVVVGGISGIVGLILDKTTDWFTDAPGNSAITGFVLGFIVGLVLCSIFMSTIGSAVNATIVLFAEAPAEFEQNYPELSSQMRAAWRDAYPGSI